MEACVFPGQSKPKIRYLLYPNPSMNIVLCFWWCHFYKLASFALGKSRKVGKQAQMCVGRQSELDTGIQFGRCQSLKYTTKLRVFKYNIVHTFFSHFNIKLTGDVDSWFSCEFVFHEGNTNWKRVTWIMCLHRFHIQPRIVDGYWLHPCHRYAIIRGTTWKK